MSAPLAPEVVLRALGAVGFIRWRLRAAQPEPEDIRIPVALVGDLNLVEHLGVFHDMPTGDGAPRNVLVRLHRRLHERGRARVPHWHSAAVSDRIQAEEAAEREAADAFRRALAGLPIDGPSA
jgi:hypothetical protein